MQTSDRKQLGAVAILPLTSVRRLFVCVCVFCAGLTETGPAQGTVARHRTEPSFPTTFYRIPGAAGHFERQVASSETFLQLIGEQGRNGGSVGRS